MNSLTIKIANPNDVETIYYLDQEYDYERYSRSMIENSLIDKNNLNLIYYSSDDPIGYISFNYIIDEASLLKIVVAKKYRRQGIGKFLIEKSLEVLKEKGVKFVFLEVRKSNSSAIMLYENSGFKIIHKRQKYYDDGEDAIIYRLSLDEWNKL